MSVSADRTLASVLLIGAVRTTAATQTAFGADAYASTDAAGTAATSLDEVVVTAARLELLGTAATASEGVVADQELQLTPQHRPGQLLETVPGLVVTLHSGEGKANRVTAISITIRSPPAPAWIPPLCMIFRAWQVRVPTHRRRLTRSVPEASAN
jgi:hypothetical protein